MEATDIAVTAVLLALITFGIARWIRDRATVTTTTKPGAHMTPTNITLKNLTPERAQELDKILADIVTREIDRVILRGENKQAMYEHLAALAEIRSAVLTLARVFDAQGVYRDKN